MREMMFRAYVQPTRWDDLTLPKLQRKIIPISSIDFVAKTCGKNYADEYDLADVELMQYTGLKDNDGLEIFEGDIVVIDMWQGNEHGYIAEDGIIAWHQESSAFKWFSGELSDGNNYWLTQADELQRKVIGNIYENPELLKAGESASLDV